MDAAVILQDYLDVVGAAVMAGDWETYRSKVCIPFNLVTHSANITVDTQDMLRDGYDTFCSTLKSQRVTDYIRLVQSAARLDTNLISGSYVTHIIASDTRVVPPYRSQITLRWECEMWTAASITNELTNHRWPLLVPSPADFPSSEGTPT